VDSLLYGVAGRLSTGSVSDTDALTRENQELLGNPDYRAATETGTSQEAKVETRLRLDEEAFAGVP
jgi:hypothetical protein